MSGTLLLVALLLATQAPASPTPARPAPSRPGLSWEEADSVTRVLRRIDRRLRSGRPASRDTIVVTEGQLNSFVNLTLAEKIPPEMSDLELDLRQDRLGARVLLDLDRLRAKMPEGGPASLLSMLTGVVPVELSGRVESAEGLCRVDLEEIFIGGVSLPPALLAQIVSFATRNEERPQGLDITAPVALPWTARQVRVRPGRALVDFYN
ncbi:MAG: hypothetical protein LJF30_06945 [Acidobacteria bacterium]|jgi:hypothetical protein|nr:hypothetical protein [Acidobacteriota bacterium]